MVLLFLKKEDAFSIDYVIVDRTYWKIWKDCVAILQFDYISKQDSSVGVEIHIKARG